jgi:hypothetical protein
MVVSSKAFRFCGRDSRKIAISPRRLAVSEAGSLGANGLTEGFLDGFRMPDSCGLHSGRSSGTRCHSGARRRREPGIQKQPRERIWIPGSPLRGAPE